VTAQPLPLEPSNRGGGILIKYTSKSMRWILQLSCISIVNKRLSPLFPETARRCANYLPIPAVEHLLSNSSATVVRCWFTGEAKRHWTKPQTMHSPSQQQLQGIGFHRKSEQLPPLNSFAVL